MSHRWVTAAVIFLVVAGAPTAAAQARLGPPPPPVCDRPHPPPKCFPGSPTGAFTEVSRNPAGIHVSGSARDPDAVGPVTVTVTVDDTAVGQLRADGPGDAYSGTVPARPGSNVCLTAINRNQGIDAPLGCKQFSVQVNPFGYLDDVSVNADGLRVSGWAIDPDSDQPVQMWIFIDGVVKNITLASQPRPDVAAVYPGYGAQHGFDVTLPDIRHSKVCPYALNVGLGASTTLNCARDKHSLSVFNLNLQGTDNDYPNDNGVGATHIAWRDRYMRIAAWMGNTGTVPDVITLEEVWAWKQYIFPLPHDDPAPYDTLGTLISDINSRTGAHYRIAYLEAAHVPQGINTLMAGDAVLYNADRVRNATMLLPSATITDDESSVGVHMRKSVSDCGAYCAVRDKEGVAWVSSSTQPAAKWMMGPSAAIFELITDPGKYVPVHNLHRSGDFDTYNLALRDLEYTIRHQWAGKGRLMPSIIAGDFNGTPDPSLEYDVTVNSDVDYILRDRTFAHPPLAETEVTPTVSPNPDHCGSIATLLSDHCAIFAQYFPVPAGG